MKDLNKLSFHPTQEKIVDILVAQTQNTERLFFRLSTAYFFAKMAAMMRTQLAIPGRDIIPINFYAFNLATSGAGKGHSLHILEEQVVNGFRDHFLERAFPLAAEENIAKMANKRAVKSGSGDPDREYETLMREFKEHGELAFSFDSATTPAIKQMRHKLLMANAGAMCMELDEVGHNFTSNIDVLTTLLELYDLGKVKDKLVKSTKENVRATPLFGSTPTNMLLFGTPTKLLNGDKVETEFYEMLESGYARRSFFSYSRTKKTNANKYTPQEVYNIFTDKSSEEYLIKLSDQFADLADPVNFHTRLRMEQPVALKWLEYKLHCEREADLLSEYEEIAKAELMHRHFKVAKLAGAYAFVDQSMSVKEDHIYNAIAMAEQSGKALHDILNRDRPYVKLANFICSIRKEVTQADLLEDLPFYKGSEAQRREMMTLATAWAYRNNMTITKTKIDEIDFYSGKSYAPTNLDSLILSYSKEMTQGYRNELVKFTNLPKLLGKLGYHWVNHHLEPLEEGKGGYRDEEHCKPGFNMVVLDIDKETSIELAKHVLEDYTYILHTTKSHSDLEHRFRVILPISHVLEMGEDDFKAFMKNVYAQFPFNVDLQTNQRSRKWLTHNGKLFTNTGKILPAFNFIPNTKQAEEAKTKLIQQSNMSGLERWFVNEAEEGNRNNMLFRYAACLVDLGHSVDSIRNNVLALNSKLDTPLSEMEVMSTVIVSATKMVASRNNP